MIEFECLGCGTTFEVSDSLAGKVIKCRECHQPGKVHAPNGNSARSKSGERSEKVEKPTVASTLASTLKGSYACPCCGTRVLWEWRRSWTPASTLLLVVGLFANWYTIMWCWSIYSRAQTMNVSELDAKISGGGIIGIFVLLCVAATVDVLAFRLLWDWRQTCPRCGIRLG